MDKNTLLIVGTPVGYALRQSCSALGIKIITTYENPQRFSFGKLREKHFGITGEKLLMNSKMLKIEDENYTISCDAIVIDLLQPGAIDFCTKLRFAWSRIPVKLLTSSSYHERDLLLLPPTHRLIDYLEFISNPPEPNNSFLLVSVNQINTIKNRAHSLVQDLKKKFPNNEKEAKLVLKEITTKDELTGFMVARLSKKLGSILAVLRRLIGE